MKYKAVITEAWLATTFFDADTIEEAEEIVNRWRKGHGYEFEYDKDIDTEITEA